VRGTVANVARPITVAMALLLFVALALTAASELGAEVPGSGTIGLAGAPLGGDAPHDCQLVPLHGAQYVAGASSVQPRHIQLTSYDAPETDVSAASWHAGARLGVARELGPGGRELRARCAPQALQVFRH